MPINYRINFVCNIFYIKSLYQFLPKQKYHNYQKHRTYGLKYLQHTFFPYKYLRVFIPNIQYLFQMFF